MRAVHDAPRIAARLKTHPQVRETVVVAFPDRRAGTGLYAFVEGGPGLTERGLREFIAADTSPESTPMPRPPEHLQVAEELPRSASGEVRSEILQLVAMNQLDLIEPLITNEVDRTFMKDILESRKNLRDRFNFESSELNSR